jgi:transcription antitermination protein NusB
MLNRRHIRIKILQILYAYSRNESTDLNQADKEFTHSVEKTYEMYLYLLLFILDMQALAIEKIEAGKNKRLPTKEELYPNTRFVTNELLRKIVYSKSLKKEAQRIGVSWDDNPDIARKFFKQLVETEEYKEYMELSERNFDVDSDYLLRFFRRHMINFELLQDYFEEKSIYWNDDIDIVASMIIKTLRAVKEDDDDIALLPLWKADGEERDFAYDLLHKTMLRSKEMEGYIKGSADNWETDRIAVMDMVIMKMALTEAIIFPEIPLKVTLNEYIELAKFYSTEKSGGFINGILDKLFGELKQKGIIKKTGRGLIE